MGLYFLFESHKTDSIMFFVFKRHRITQLGMGNIHLKDVQMWFLSEKIFSLTILQLASVTVILKWKLKEWKSEEKIKLEIMTSFLTVNLDSFVR